MMRNMRVTTFRMTKILRRITKYDADVNEDTFGGQSAANYRYADLTRDADKAMARYIDNPTEENRQVAYAYDALARKYAENNKAALDDEGAVLPWISKSAAGYMPQFLDQIGPQLLGGGTGALVGSAFGAPTVGASIGAGLATGAQSYDVVKGSVYRNLLIAGVDEKIAIEAAKDEALISAIIEGGGTALSFLAMGGGKAISAIGSAAKASVAKGSTNVAVKLVATLAGKAGTKATTKAATKAASEVAKPLWRKGLEATFGIAANSLSEYGEEFLQEDVSIANEERALKGETGKANLIGHSTTKLWDAVTGKDDAARARMREAGKEGSKIALMFGGSSTVVNNTIAHYANAKTVEAQNEIADAIIEDEETLNALIEEGKASGEGTVSAKIAKEVEAAKEKGEVTRDQVKKLIASNEVYIKEEEKATEAETKAVTTTTDSRIYNWLEEQSKANESVDVADVQAESGFGENGAKLLAELTNTDGMTYGKAKNALRAAYFDGFANAEKSNEGYTDVWEKLAFNAGKLDLIKQDTRAQSNAKNATVYNDTVFDFPKSEYFKKLSPADQKQHYQIAKDLGLRMEFVDKLFADKKGRVEANAQHVDGIYTRSDNSENEAHIDVVHEALHRMKQVAPKETRELIEAIYKIVEYPTNVVGASVFDEIKADHDNAGISMETSDYLEEIAARTMPKLFNSPEAWNAWREKLDSDPNLRGNWEKFVDFLKELIEKVKTFLSQARMSPEKRAEAKQKIAELEHINELYANAYKAARDAVSEKLKNLQNNEEVKSTKGYNGNVSNSLKKPYWHTDLSPTQIKQVLEQLERVGTPEARSITDTAYWYKGRLNGKDLFVIYSMEDADGPTILYVNKKATAKAELDILQKALEVIDNERSAVEKSRIVNEIFGIGNRVQKKRNVENNNVRLGARGSDTGYASVLQGKSSEFVGSPAFRNVIRNIFEIQESKLTRHSIKGSDFTSDLLDVVWDMQTGKKGAIKKLQKYVENGRISAQNYNKLVERYGAIPVGENPHRDIQVPKKAENGKKVSQTVRTILEAEATPDEAIPTIEKMVEDGVFSYDVYTDKQAISDAESHIEKNGWVKSLSKWFDSVEKGEVSKELTAMGWALYNNAANTAATTSDSDTKKTAIQTSLQILDAMVKHQRSAAQALQATRILKKLSPETQLYAIQRSVSSLQEELIKKYGKKAPDLKIDESLAERFLQAESKEDRIEIEKEIYRDIGRQMPSDWLDKWTAWRYLAMLGSLRTHINNIGGNAGFAPAVAMKNLVATTIEPIVYYVSGKKMLRSKSLIRGSKADRALLKAAWLDYSKVNDIISNGGKYNDNVSSNKYIEEGRRIFKSKPLEWARKTNSALLEVEDMWFSRPHYAFALAMYCKANNITPEQIARGKAIAPAREYAIKEAQKGTYRDTNAFSQFVSSIGRNGKHRNAVTKAGSVVVEGLQPFRTTPANILVRGVEYSPIGLLKGLSRDLYQVSKGKMSAAEAIDNISAGLTGTGLLILGFNLAAQGLIRGHGEEDKEEKEFKELMGHQAYALELPNGTSVTLDWLAPGSLPFFVGVNICEATRGPNEEVNLSSILKAVSNISEPMLEMSCLQGINDMIDSVGYASSNDTSGLVSILASATTSYLMQALPTLGGQSERTGEDYRMTTFTEKNDFLTGDMQYVLGKASAKIPFFDYNQIPYIDAWGRKEASGTALKRGLNNFLNPAYTSTIEESKMEKELLRLYKETGETSVFPERADKYFTVDGKRKDLTADEYVRYAILKGEKSYKLISDLVQSKAYRSLSDKEKVKAVEEAYDYANQKAKSTISRYKPDSWVKKADDFGSNVGNYLSFRANVSNTKKDNGNKISKQEVVDIIPKLAQNDSEAWDMYLSMYDNKGAIYAHESGVESDDYFDLIEALDRVDKPTESGIYGTYSQEEAYTAISMLKGLSRKDKAILWQSVNPQWKNNPFG